DNNLLVRDFMREPHFVPETKNLEMLLNEFRRRGIHIAMVTDEFGDFVGIITLEDILESLVGEIIDEYDETGDIPYQSLGDNLYLFDGGVSIQNVYHILKPGHFEESGERLSAFLFRNFGHIPKEGESLSYHGLIFTIKEIKGRKIKKVIVQRQ
ncbi:MAG: transporter associated domain-containing protein, partial [candidate division WOR-3 bacterium]